MTTENPTQVFKVWREAAEKFDYFLLGATGAICAYVLQNYKPAHVGLNSKTLELAGLLLLFTSAYKGFRRLETLIIATRENFERVQSDEILAALGTRGTQAWFDFANGRHLTDDEADQKIRALVRERESLSKKIGDAASRASRHYALRNRFLFAGFTLLILARVWSGYE